MGIFDRIRNAIWGAEEEEIAPDAGKAGVTPVAASAASPAARSAPEAARAQPAPASATPAARPVDVAAVLDAAVKRKGQSLNWRTSIVDLMKALDLDSSLSNRKELAGELGYGGDTSDSASMNIWLHRQVILKLKENGGKVPAELA